MAPTIEPARVPGGESLQSSPTASAASPSKASKFHSAAVMASSVSKVDWGEAAASANLHNAILLTECAEIETRLRQHVLQLIDPTVQRQRLFDTRLKEIKAQVDENATKVIELNHALRGQDSVNFVLESFRSELAQWNKEQHEHEQMVGDRCSVQEIEIGELRRSIDKKTADITASNRALKSLGESVAESREEVSQLRKFCNMNLDIIRDKLFKLRDEFETRQLTFESEQQKLAEGQSEFIAAVRSMHLELQCMRADVDEANEKTVTLERTKADVWCLEAQQMEFSEFSRRIEANVSGHGKQVGVLVDDVKAHFKTAADAVNTGTSQLMHEMRSKYDNEVKRIRTVVAEVDSFFAKHSKLSEELQTSFSETSAKTVAELEFMKSDMKQSLKRREVECKEMAIEVKRIGRLLRDPHGGGTRQVDKTGKTAPDSGISGGDNISSALPVHHDMTVIKDALDMLVESSLLNCTMELRDDEDRRNIALFGMKPGEAVETTRSGVLPDLNVGRNSARAQFAATPRRTMKESTLTPRATMTQAGEGWLRPGGSEMILTLDKRCLACSGSQATVLAGFKLACLHYAPSPVVYLDVKYSRAELIRLRIDLLKQAKAQLSIVE